MYFANQNFHQTPSLSVIISQRVMRLSANIIDNHTQNFGYQIWFCTRLFIMDHSECGISQWETTLQRNVVSHWLSPYPERSLVISIW